MLYWDALAIACVQHIHFRKKYLELFFRIYIDILENVIKRFLLKQLVGFTNMNAS